MSKRMTVYYAAGPGDVATTLRRWSEGKDDPDKISVPYSGQVYEVCRKHGWYLVIDCDRDAAPPVKIDGAEIRSWPVPFKNAIGVLYNLGQILSGLRMCWRSWRAGANVAIISHGCHWFALAPMRLVGIRIIPSLHCTFWPKGNRRGGIRSVIEWLNGIFWRWCVQSTVAISGECERQLRLVSPKYSSPVYIGRAYYRRELFDAIRPKVWDDAPFTVVYAGRITRDKGVVNLMDVAAEVKGRVPRRVYFEICGDGPAMPEVRTKVRELGLDQDVVLHGQLNRDGMLEVLSRAHVAVVPTTRSFIEGFCMAAVEPVIAGRPVICSDVVPALECLGESAVEVPGDNWAAFADAIVEMATNREAWEKRQIQTKINRDQFLDPSCIWGNSVESALKGTI